MSATEPEQIPPSPATVNTEQSQESLAPPTIASPEELARLRELASGLLAELARVQDGDLVADIIGTSLKLLGDHTNRGDVRLINRSVKEMRYALKVFAPYNTTRKVTIFGSARTPPASPEYQQAVAFAHGMAAAGWMVITGAGGGIMEAGNDGAGAAPSFGLAIRLPFEQTTNPVIAGDKKLINFNYFFTRKLMFVRASHAIVIFPGGFGTMDEGFEALTLVQTGKSVPMPIVMVEHPGGDYWKSWEDYIDGLLERGLISHDDRRLYKITNSIEEAIAEVQRFYRNYHSLRYSRDELILRLRQRPTEEQLEAITARFSDLLAHGGFRASDALPVEHDEVALAELPRLVFCFNRRDHARLRMLIDYLNLLVTE